MKLYIQYFTPMILTGGLGYFILNKYLPDYLPSLYLGLMLALFILSFGFILTGAIIKKTNPGKFFDFFRLGKVIKFFVSILILLVFMLLDRANALSIGLIFFVMSVVMLISDIIFYIRISKT